VALGSGITSLGVSSPPRVRAAPVKREGAARGSSPPGLPTFLMVFNTETVADNGVTYFFALSRIFFFRSSGFSTAKPDFSPPAYKFWLSSSSGS
jgi:hypothetical protein